MKEEGEIRQNGDSTIKHITIDLIDPLRTKSIFLIPSSLIQIKIKVPSICCRPSH